MKKIITLINLKHKNSAAILEYESFEKGEGELIFSAKESPMRVAVSSLQHLFGVNGLFSHDKGWHDDVILHKVEKNKYRAVSNYGDWPIKSYMDVATISLIK